MQSIIDILDTMPRSEKIVGVMVAAIFPIIFTLIAVIIP